MNKKIEKVKGKTNGAEVKFYRDGNLTVCIIQMGKKELVGFSKLNPNCDTMSRQLGDEIAYKRALKKITLERGK